MPYNKTNWKSGDIVTSEKLNKLEDAVYLISGAISCPILLAELSEEQDKYILNITPNDIFDEDGNVKCICFLMASIPGYFNIGVMTNGRIEESDDYPTFYSIDFFNGVNKSQFISESIDAYFEALAEGDPAT